VNGAEWQLGETIGWESPESSFDPLVIKGATEALARTGVVSHLQGSLK